MPDSSERVSWLESKVSRLRDFYATLAHINGVMTRIENRDSLFAEICEIVTTFGGFRTAWIGLVGDNGELEPTAHSGHCSEYVKALRVSVHPDDSIGRGPAGTAVRENRIDYILDTANDPRAKPWKEEMLRCGFYSTIAAPLHHNGAPVGVLTLYAGKLHAFGQEEMRLVEQISDAISFAMEYLEQQKARLSAERKAHFLAYYDPLTKLPNRVQMRALLHDALQQIDSGSSVAVALVDLDNLKEVNDSLGHSGGDSFLQIVSKRLSEAFPLETSIARLGGDEFVCILKEIPSKNELIRLLDDICEIIRNPVVLQERKWRVTCSIGITVQTERTAHIESVLSRADTAMYEAKHRGGNQVSFFSEEMQNKKEMKQQTRNQLMHALSRNELCLYYQPQVNMRTGKVIRLEALLRWKHPSKGLLLPASFLDSVKNHPVMNDIGLWVISEALAQMNAWRKQGLKLDVSVNISAKQFQDENFLPNVKSLLRYHSDIHPSRLTFELLEDSLTHDYETVERNIVQCNELGIRVSLDDFGTGYSSLMHLERLSIAEVKIDQGFVQRLLERPRNLSIVSGLLTTALSSQLDVIAEGVEDVEIGTLLRQLGCEYAQGYAISKPMPATMMNSFLASWGNIPEWNGAGQWRLRMTDLPAVAAIYLHQQNAKEVVQLLRLSDISDMSHLLHAKNEQCGFERWYKTIGHRYYSSLEATSNIEDVHQELHRLIEDGLCSYENGDSIGAAKTADEIEELLPDFMHAFNAFVHEMTS